ncbi:interleukin-2 receptor subunit beta-like [Megalops cyprinoides]|uniref:interleukin-2 receptor subunit beta-like n=1 Tax=Megalops cyprinoides TaxID=118141 RepID=UPI0018646E3A|nr:interleukin-2 receptor subunit beta-like [Megalops cyprinoides]XP_036404757.1 interleukin-2 receptor subunit beta-like [Megalops cyprinoides]
METLWLFHLFLLLIIQPQPSNTHKNLTCLNDYVTSITCIWDSTETAPNIDCSLHGTLGRRNPSKPHCKLKPLGGQNPTLRHCRLNFTRVFGRTDKIPINVICENSTQPVVQIAQYQPYLNIKMNPPGIPTISNDNVSWTRGSPFSHYLESYQFQLQYTQADQRIEDGMLIELQNKETWCVLSEELQKGAHYKARVRVRPSVGYDGEWSPWSPVASWTSEAGRLPGHSGGREERWLEVVIGCTALALILLAVVIFVPRHTSWIYKVSCQAVPDPAKYFDTLHLVHNGNFQKWLGPMFPRESFDILQHPEDISPVEVTNKDTDTLFRRENIAALEQLESSGQSSSFSNIGYFYSRYPYDSEPCSVYFSYQATAGATEEKKDEREAVKSGTIEICSSYECLQKLGDRKEEEEPIHPDSGFGVGSDDQESDEDREDEDRLSELSDTTSGSHPMPILPFPPPLGKSPFPAFFSHNGLGSPHLPFPLGAALASNHTSRQIEETLSKACFGNIEPSSGGYMPVKDT